MSLSFLAALAFSGMIGLSLGLIGGGGSIITVPILVYIAGMNPQSAVGMSLAIVGTTSMVGAGFHYSRGTIDLRRGFLFSGFGLGGAYFGSAFTRLVAAETLLLIFAFLMIIVALMMIFRKSPVQLKRIGDPVDFRKMALVGLLVGLLTGFLGVGGGFLIVPALVLFSGVEINEAVGTSLLVISTNSIAGLFGQLRSHPLDFQTAALYCVVASAGVWQGALWGQGFSPERLKKGFAFFVLAVAFFLILKNYESLIR